MDKLWFGGYQKGVPQEIDLPKHSSLVSLLQESCTLYAKRIAYSNRGNTLSYQDLNRLSRNLAAYMQQLGLEKNARIAIIMPNLLQYPVALFAILRAGYVVVNTNPLYTAEELVHQLKDSGAQMAIVLANFAKTLEKALPSLPQLQHVLVTEVGDLFPFIKRSLVNFVVRHYKKGVPSFAIPHAVTFRYALLEGEESVFHPVTLLQKDTAFLQYTGGTTGIAKGAVLTHGNLLANLLQAEAWIAPLALNQEEVVVTAIPLYHIFSLTANCLLFLKMGAKNILITNPRDTQQFIKEIMHSKFTVVTGVNTLYNALLNHPQFKEIDISQLKLALSGGMSLQKKVALHWYEATKTPLLEAYGLTEASPAVTINPMDLKSYNGSIGLPIPSTEVSIRDEQEQEVPLGTPGELCLKGPQIMHAYWNNPDETAKAFTKDGFFKTGDLVKMDQQGFIYLVDRKKDMILISGFNVYPNEIEQIIGMHPSVLEVGVVGIMDENANEQIKACIVKKDLTLSAEQILVHCKKYLTAYKIPKIVKFVPELPKTNLGKIMRRALGPL